MQKEKIPEEYSLELNGGANPEEVARELGMVLKGRVGSLPNWWVFSIPEEAGSRSRATVEDSLSGHGSVVSFQREERRILSRPVPEDF